MTSSLEEQNNIYYNMYHERSLAGEQYSGVLWTLWKVVYGLHMQQITSREWQQYSLLSVSGRRVTKLLSCGCVLARDQGNEFGNF